MNVEDNAARAPSQRNTDAPSARAVGQPRFAAGSAEGSAGRAGGRGQSGARGGRAGARGRARTADLREHGEERRHIDRIRRQQDGGALVELPSRLLLGRGDGTGPLLPLLDVLGHRAPAPPAEQPRPLVRLGRGARDVSADCGDGVRSSANRAGAVGRRGERRPLGLGGRGRELLATPDLAQKLGAERRFLAPSQPQWGALSPSSLASQRCDFEFAWKN